MTTQKKTTIGGQAIIEGIVMKGPKKSCTVVRKANGELVSKTEPTPSRAPIWEKPIFRGAYTLFTAMKEGMQAINYSASFFEDEEADVPPSRLRSISICLPSPPYFAALSRIFRNTCFMRWRSPLM